MAEPKDKGLPDGDGRYMMVNIVARRARDINKGRVATMFDDDAPDPLDVALNEYKNNLLGYEFRHHLVGQGEDYRSG